MNVSKMLSYVFLVTLFLGPQTLLAGPGCEDCNIEPVMVEKTNPVTEKKEVEKDESLLQCEHYKWAIMKIKDCIRCHAVSGGEWKIKPSSLKGLEEWPVWIEPRVENGKVVPVYVLEGVADLPMTYIYNFFMRYPHYKKFILDIQSYGGGIFSAKRIISLVDRLKEHGIIVQTEVNGMALSAGLLIFLAGTDNYRLVHPYAELMMHELWSFTFWAIETPSDKEQEAAYLRHLQDGLSNYIAERTGFTKEKIDSLIKRRDHWINGKEAVAQGFADGFVTKGK